MMRIISLFTLAAALTFSACDKAAEDRKEVAKDQADAIDKKADATKAEAKADAKATEASGEEASKAMKAKADAVRDQKQ